MKLSKIQRKRARNGFGREKHLSFEYTIRTKSNINVCKKFFLHILQISAGRLYRCLTKPEVFAVIDHRGTNIPNNKIDDSEVIIHIKSFPSYQSHHSRKDNEQRRYLHPSINLRKVYDLYGEQCAQKNKQPVKEKFYYRVFSSKFNLYFKIPSKDTCRLCDELQLKIRAEIDQERKSS